MAVERGDAVGEPVQAAIALNLRTADAVIPDQHVEHLLLQPDRDPGARSLTVLGDIGQPSATMKYAVDSIASGGRSPRSTSTVTGTGLRPAMAEMAASRPRSVSTAG